MYAVLSMAIKEPLTLTEDLINSAGYIVCVYDNHNFVLYFFGRS